MSGGSSKGKGASSAPTYAVDLIWGLGEGMITSVPTVYRNQKTTTLAKLGLTLFQGAVGQAVWSYLTTKYPGQAVPYSGVAYLAGQNFNLGNSNALPNDNFEVVGILAGTACMDADPSQVIEDILSNTRYGAGFPLTAIGTLRRAQETFTVPTGLQVTVSEAAQFFANLSVSSGGVKLACVASSPGPNQYSFAAGVYTFNSAQLSASVLITYSWLDGLVDYQAFALASGLWISPSYDNQSDTASVVKNITDLTYSEMVWSGGVLTVVPRGVVPVDGTITGSTCVIPGAPGLGELTFFWKWKGADITLSANNTVATAGNLMGANETVAINVAIPKGGKYRYQIQVSPGFSGAIGAISPLSGFTPPPPDIATVFSNSSWGIQGNGCTGRMISAPAGWPTSCTFSYCPIDGYTGGDIIDVCVDTTGANALWWFRTIHNGVVGAWNDSDDVGLPSDPAAGTGHFTSGMSAGPDSGWYPAVSFYNASTTFTTWNGGPAFTVGATPAGFVPLNEFFQFSPLTVQFDLGLDDFRPNAGSGSAGSTSDDPVIVTRKRQADQLNTVRVEFLDRANQYAASIAEQTDRALVDRYGRRYSDSQQAHLFTTSMSANIAAQLLLQKEAILKTYTFTLDERYIVLDPMDLVTLTEPGIGLDHELVRILEMTEQDNGDILFVAEEVPTGTGGLALYSFNGSIGAQPDTSISGGPTNPPVFFVEPTLLSGGSNLLAMALSGQSSNWGGCQVWVSLDGGSSYSQIGTKFGADVMGVTTTALPAVASPDTADTLGVNVGESFGAIASATPADAEAGRSLAYLDGELIGYTDATLTGTYTYNLDTYLARGLYGTPILDHASGRPFAIATKSTFTYPFSTNDIGTTLYFKFPSFNIFGDAQQALSDAVAYPFVLGVPSTMMITASENIAAGALVNIWDNSGVANVRNANATTGSKPADGFVLSAITTGNPVAVYFPGTIITGLTGLTPGATYYLDTTNGNMTLTPPSSSGNLVQQVAKALSATSAIFFPYPGIVL